MYHNNEDAEGSKGNPKLANGADKDCTKKGKGNGIELSTLSFGGWSAKFFGRDMLLVIIISIMLFFMYRINQDHIQIKNEIGIQTWILSLPPDSRPQLIMPPAARDRILRK